MGKEAEEKTHPYITLQAAKREGGKEGRGTRSMLSEQEQSRMENTFGF